MILDDLAIAVTNSTTVAGSAVTLINGFAGRLQAAVELALANGATQAQLQPVIDEVNSLNDSSTALAAAVAANT